MLSIVPILAIFSLAIAAPVVEQRSIDGISHAEASDVEPNLVDQGLGRPCLRWNLNYNDYPKSECWYWFTLDNRDYDAKFWRFKKDWTSSDDQEAAMASFEKGTLAALDVNIKFAHVSNIKVRIVLTSDDLGPNVVAVTSPGAFQNGEPDWYWCAIRIKRQAPDGNCDADLKQVVAHKLYHYIEYTK